MGPGRPNCRCKLRNCVIFAVEIHVGNGGGGDLKDREVKKEKLPVM